MAFINCKLCGQLTKVENDILCKSCAEKMDNPYQKIRDYLMFHNGADIFELSEATGVPKSLILQYIKEDRISPIGK